MNTTRGSDEDETRGHHDDETDERRERSPPHDGHRGDPGGSGHRDDHTRDGRHRAEQATGELHRRHEVRRVA